MTLRKETGVPTAEVKPLLEFTLSDLAVLATSCRKLALTFDRRAEWASYTQEKLVEHGKTKIGNLPQPVLKEVAERAGDAFGRQE